MVIALTLTHVWAVMQLLILGSFARTVRARTVLAAMTVGLYACAPLTAFLQVLWTRPAAALTGISSQSLSYIASYTFDPFLEEAMKLLPLALLLSIRLYRRQWTFTDFVLIAAATGAGFGMAEDLYRFGAASDHAQATSGGWAVALTDTYAMIPGVGRTLVSWLPTGVSWAGKKTDMDLHLVWSAIGGLAVALTVLKRTAAARITAAALFLCIGLDHAAGNVRDLSTTWLAYLAIPLRGLAHIRGFLPIAALAAAWWFDQQRQGIPHSDNPQLEAEKSASAPIVGVLGAAASRLPWSLPLVDRFVRMRRAYRTERASTPAGANVLHAALVNEKNRVDRELAELRLRRPALWPQAWSIAALRASIRRRAVILWLIVMLPSVLWFVVGGWPQTAGLQAFMLKPLVFKMLFFPISALAQAWLVWRTIIGLRAWSKTNSHLIGDDAAAAGLRLACGMGAIGLGAFSLLRLLGGVPPGASLLSNLHAQDAANRLTPGAGSMLADGGAAFAPPLANSNSKPGSAADGDRPGSPTPEPTPSPTPPDVAASAQPHSADAADGGGAIDAPPPTRDLGEIDAPPPTRDLGEIDAPRPNLRSPADDAASAQQHAADAADDALEAQQQRRQAQDAADSAEIHRTTADANSDPNVAAAHDRAHQAHDADQAADVAASNEFDDPWGEKNAKKAAAEQAHAAAKQADADANAADQDFYQKQADKVDAAKEAAKQADADASAAAQRAAESQADANAKAQAAQQAADQQAAAARKAGDPEGVAAEDAAAQAAAAQRKADEAFGKTGPGSDKNYHDANAAARAAQERADAAQAAADAAHHSREARNQSASSKPDKP